MNTGSGDSCVRPRLSVHAGALLASLLSCCAGGADSKDAQSALTDDQATSSAAGASTNADSPQTEADAAENSSGDLDAAPGSAQSGNSDAANSGSNNSTSNNSTSNNSEAAAVSNEPAAPIDCDTPPVGIGSCWTSEHCNEGADEFNASVLMTICIPGLGFTPSDESCSDFQLLGRCYDPGSGSWKHSYFGYMRPNAAELEAACLAAAGIWCTGPLGVPDSTSRECRRACDDARPDYADEPECEYSDTCFSDCLAAVGADGGSPESVTARIEWPAGSCGEFECSCPPATF